MHKFPFVTVDVFSSRALEGNPVAVFTDARGLSDAEMQAIALEMRLSETTFIIPRDEATERAEGVMVRIFTVAEELPFAGHPTLGTASVVAHARHATEVALDLKVGKIPISFKAAPDGLFGEMTHFQPMYTFDDDRQGWAKRAEAEATENRVLAPGKPVDFDPRPQYCDGTPKH